MSPEFASQTRTHLKDALRSLRYTLRVSRDTVRKVAPCKIPAPASGVALTALGEIESLARNIDELACKLANCADQDMTKLRNLREIKASSQRQYEFSAAFYVTLQLVLTRLGAKRTLVKQSSALSAFDRQSAYEDVYQLAAKLTRDLASERSIVIGQVDERMLANGHGLIVIAVFAGILALLVVQDGCDRNAIVTAATDMALACRERILSIYQSGDHSALAELYEWTSGHV